MNKIVVRRSLLVDMSLALMLQYNLISAMGEVYFHISSASFLRVTMSILFIVVLLFIPESRQSLYKNGAALLGVIGLVAIAFAFSFLLMECTTGTKSYLAFFSFFGVLSLLIGCQKACIKNVCIISMIIGAFAFPLILEQLTHPIRNVIILEMGLSYAILPTIVIGGLFCINYYANTRSFVLRALALYCVVLLIPMFVNGTRGGVLALVVFLFLVIVNRQALKKNHSIRARIIVGLAIVAVLIICALLPDIMVALNKVTASLGIRINIISKSYNLLVYEGDISNNRLFLYQSAWDGFLDSPIWGHGIGSFMNAMGGATYPHNFVLQLLFEGGVLLTAPIVFLVAKAFFYVLYAKGGKETDYGLLILLISCGLPRLMFSAILWKSQFFWLLIGTYLFSRKESKVCPRTKAEILKEDN